MPCSFEERFISHIAGGVEKRCHLFPQAVPFWPFCLQNKSFHYWKCCIDCCPVEGYIQASRRAISRKVDIYQRPDSIYVDISWDGWVRFLWVCGLPAQTFSEAALSKNEQSWIHAVLSFWSHMLCAIFSIVLPNPLPRQKYFTSHLYVMAGNRRALICIMQQLWMVLRQFYDYVCNSSA